MLTTSNPILDLGTIQQGVVLNESFVVRNNSNHSITIDRVATSCGCTTTKKYDNIILQAKESISISFGFNSAGKLGNITKSIHIHYTYGGKSHILTQQFKVTVIK